MQIGSVHATIRNAYDYEQAAQPENSAPGHLRIMSNPAYNTEQSAQRPAAQRADAQRADGAA